MIKVVAGVDIDGTNTVYGLVERTGNIVAGTNLKTTDYPEIHNFVIALAGAINNGMNLSSNDILGMNNFLL